MGIETPKQPTPEEQAKIEAERTLSDAELIKGGAEYKIDEEGKKRLEVTADQIETAREEMEYVEELKSEINEALQENTENNKSEGEIDINRMSYEEKLRLRGYGWDKWGEIGTKTREMEEIGKNLAFTGTLVGLGVSVAGGIASLPFLATGVAIIGAGFLIEKGMVYFAVKKGELEKLELIKFKKADLLKK